MKYKNIFGILLILLTFSIGLTNCRKPELREVKVLPVTSFMFDIGFHTQVVLFPDTFWTVPYDCNFTWYINFDTPNENNQNTDLPLYFPDGNIKSIHIYSDSAYDANHPAGTYWDDIITVEHVGGTNYYFNTTYDNYPVRLDSFNLLHLHCEAAWRIKFISPPDKPRKHLLHTTMDLMSGEHFEYYLLSPIQITDD